jgi:hypothetical protein
MWEDTGARYPKRGDKDWRVDQRCTRTGCDATRTRTA